MKINDSTIAVAELLKLGAYKACLVGEGVLDLILHGEIRTNKIEIATNATVSELSLLFTTDNKDYTILYTSYNMLTVRHKESDMYFQISTFIKLTKTGSITRTDRVEPHLVFKNLNVHSMAYDLHTKELIDPYKVQQDIKDKVIKVNDEGAFNREMTLPFKIAFLCSSLGFKLNGKAASQMARQSHLIKLVSGGNVRNALDKFFTDLRKPSIALRILHRTSVLKLVLPELAASSGYALTYLECDDLFDHTLKVVDMMPSGLPKARWAALFHDLGKLKSCEHYGTGRVSFAGYETKSAETAMQVMGRLSFSRKDMMDIVRIVRTECKVQCSGEKELMGFVTEVGAHNLNDSLMIEASHRVLKGVYGMTATKSWMGMYKRRVHHLRVKNGQFIIKDLVVSGYDLMNWLKIEQGPIIGDILSRLFLLVKYDIFSNNITLLKNLSISYFNRVHEKNA